jgi:hypothetical protein
VNRHAGHNDFISIAVRARRLVNNEYNVPFVSMLIDERPRWNTIFICGPHENGVFD